MTRSSNRPLLLRNPAFLLLWTGQTVSILGTQISGLALPLLVLALTGSPAQAGVIGALRLVPYAVVGLAAGALVDRWNRKTVMIVADAVRCVALGSIPLAYALGHLAVWQLYAVSLAEGAAFTFFTIAQVASLPRVVPAESLAEANAFNEASGSVATLIGPALGGLIIGLARTVATGASLGFLADSISYLASVLSLGFIRIPFQEGRVPDAARSLRRDVVEGLRFLWARPALRILALLGFATGLLIIPIDLAVIVLARQNLHVGPRIIGLIFSAGGLGALIGAAAAAWLRDHLRLGQVIVGAIAVEALGTGLSAVAPSWPVVALSMALVTMMLPIYNVSAVTYRLSLIPDALQGRITSVFRLMPLSAQPVGMVLVGLLLGRLGARPVLAVIAAGLGLAALAVSATKLRRA